MAWRPPLLLPPARGRAPQLQHPHDTPPALQPCRQRRRRSFDWVDSVESDIAGGRGAGMRTVLYAPDGAPAGAADVVVRSWVELARLAGVAW